MSIAIAMAATLFCVAPCAAEPDYVQPGTNFHFPAQVADFSRSKITPYNAAHSDVEVDYDNDPFTVHLSVYVYPTSGPLKSHYEQCRADVSRVHPDAQLFEEKPYQIEQGGVTYQGYYALFFMRDRFIGDKEQDLLSQLIIFRRDNNYVLYRISYLRSEREKAEKQIAEFIKQFVWPPGGHDTSAEPK